MFASRASRNSLREYAKPKFKPTAGGGGGFWRGSQPESTNSVEAQCQCVIHLNTVKLKAVYGSPDPFILVNAGLLLANLSVRASTCQGEEGKKFGLSEEGFHSVSLHSACR